MQSDQKVADEIDVNICQWDKGHAGHAFLDEKVTWPLTRSGKGSRKSEATYFMIHHVVVRSFEADLTFCLELPEVHRFRFQPEQLCIPKSRLASIFFIFNMAFSFSGIIHHFQSLTSNTV